MKRSAILLAVAAAFALALPFVVKDAYWVNLAVLALMAALLLARISSEPDDDRELLRMLADADPDEQARASVAEAARATARAWA